MLAIRALNRCLISPGLYASLGNKTYPLAASIKEIQVLSPSHSSFSTLSSKFLQPWNVNGGDCTACPQSALNQVTNYVPIRGMKILGRVKRRCKDCQLEWRNGILYNFCKTHPRHKQMLKPQYWENQRILTHASQSPKRPW